MKTVLRSLGLVMLVGCLKVPGVPEDFKLDQPKARSSNATLCQDASLQADDFCMPASQMETWLRDGQIRFLDGEPTSMGASGAMKMRVGVTHPSVPDELVFDVKWRPASAKLAGLNNSPRKELAAYALQKLFLHQDEWVVPPTVMRCLPTAPGRDLLVDRAVPRDIDCVWGMLSYWLGNLEAPAAIDLGPDIATPRGRGLQGRTARAWAQGQ
ncbi:MAG: hypothetical protein GXP62_14700 [Oligoflexia bacterium]|nr:hypothetical protein [Oligoflexia bacterium]